jgi:peptide/nickel transport system substrate-binding protein
MIRGARPIDRISRRGLITSGVLAGVFAASGVPLQARTRGGVLRLGLSGGFETGGLDPRGFRSAFMRVLGQGAVFDCLTEIAATGELTGELAESWESDAEARIWTITLRQGVTFHDGTPLTAEDVLASFAWHQSGFSLAAPIIGQIAEMRSPGPGQVQFILSAGNADFPILLSDPCLIIAPSGRMTDGVGTGLYRLESFEAGVAARLVRVASHYKDGQAGWFEAVELRAINDPASRLDALLDGSVDAIDGVPPSLADQILAARDLRMTRVQGNARLLLSLPAPHAADPALARALQASVDRPALIKEHLCGIGEPAQDHPIGLSNPFIAALPEASFDPELCRWLSRRAGLALDRGTGGLVAQISAGRLTEDWAFSAAIGSGGHWSGSLGQDRAFVQLLAEARSTFDSARRAAIYAELQALSAARGGVTVAAHVPWLDAHHARLRHADDLGSSLALDSGRIAERWWFA